MKPLTSLDGVTGTMKLQALEEGLPGESGCSILCKSGGQRVLLYLRGGEAPVYPWDTLTLPVIVKTVDPKEELSYISKDITLIAYQTGDLVREREALSWWQYPVYAYTMLKLRIGQLFPEDVEPFLRALLTGDTTGLNYNLRNQMSLVGISHVVAVSGMHVSLICSLLVMLCLRRRRISAVVCLVVMWLFAAMLGFRPSVTRAVVMNSLMLLALLVGREYDGPTAICFALFLLLIPNPWAISSVSLQLSFGASAGILLFSQPLHRWIHGKLKGGKPRRPRYILVRFLSGSLATTIGASLFAVPLCAYYFGVVSLISVLSNLILLPVLTACFSVGYPLVLLSFGIYPVSRFLAQILAYPIRWVIGGIRIGASVPYGALYTISPYVTGWLIVVYILLFLGCFLKKAKTALVLILCLLLTVPFLQCIGRNRFSFTMLDVGQGQCLLMQSKDTTVVIDCGGSTGEKIGELAARNILSRSTYSIDALILTHFDMDHVGGVLQLMDRVKIQGLYVPEIPEDSEIAQEIRKEAMARKIPIHVIKQDVRLNFFNGSMDIFAPVGIKSGNDGLSLLLSSGEYDILITGDLPASGERRLVESKNLPDLEVLVAGHHGSDHSTSALLLQQCLPELLLISVGENSYGHPGTQVLERARDMGIKIYRTDRQGSITLTR
ncbi:MAG: DNA internalization-related competence protein ComEC/Rec2 [Oscillospiraceae bacterium]|nr:DNA internalization-related competence protein ComEC/Rec2 [Oscillospiraceae bacterium]